ncbi:MAG: DUF1573 domain-containing protein [Paludibacteraceae bacterium]|nr:DUF1573 domain-containing protein [Paludibacteraceae bacterium]
MKKLLLFAIAMVMAFTVSAQEQKQIIEIAEKTYDFGTIKEEDGRVSHVFTFKNVTEGALTIKNVRASCGCTTPAWSREPIAPNAEAQITVTYNASGRPGAFHKSVTVTLSNGTEDFTHVLFIKGKVTPKQVAPVAEENATAAPVVAQ